jgi:hypothetical protein
MNISMSESFRQLEKNTRKELLVAGALLAKRAYEICAYMEMKSGELRYMYKNHLA